MSHLECFSLEKRIGVCQKEVTLNHATSPEILYKTEYLD
jgi:aminoglycoside phosphotransferase family enzyme